MAIERELLARREMVELIARRGVKDPAVLEAMRRVPRHRLVPAELVDLAYDDRPLPIGQGQTISQPYMVAYMTEAARVRPGSRVLEVGTGSGYQTAVLAAIGADVYSIEIDPELAARAALVLGELGHRGVHLRLGDGSLGWPEAAPFDAIVVTAAPVVVPPALVEQLAEGGRLVIPVGEPVEQVLEVHERRAETVLVTRTLPVRFVRMTGEAGETFH